LVARAFWFFASIFIFILTADWVGLVPGVGTVGWGHQTAQGFHIDQPLFRGANSDLNLTLAMALVFFACWLIWANQELGPLGCLRALFAPEGESTGFMMQANARATRLIEEARSAAARAGDQETQKAMAAAKAILAEARETATREHERMLAQLKREIGRLVVETTAAVAGKILTAEDRQRLAEETAKQFAG
jgi:hypothetical protein